MPDIGSIFGVIFPLLSVIALAGCALLFGVQTTLRANNGDLKDRVAILEAEQKVDKETIAAQSKQISAHQGEIETFSKVITGEVHLVAITDLLSEHHAQAVAQWEGINEVLTHIDTTMAGAGELLHEQPGDKS